MFIIILLLLLIIEILGTIIAALEENSAKIRNKYKRSTTRIERNI